VRLGGPISWRISVRRWEYLIDCALWIREAERIEAPPHHLVPGRLELAELPVPTERDGVPGAEWLGWWCSLVDARRPAPPPEVTPEPADDTPDPLGLAPYPTLRRVVAGRWREANDWHLARKRDDFARHGPGSAMTSEIARQVERSLNRSLRPFSVEFLLLPVRDEVIRRVDHEHYLVPERLYDSPRWTVWLRDLVSRIG
jgi:hypothetical protein